jgi:hypothetical protein
MTRRRLLIPLLGTIGVLGLAEVLLRTIWGFGTPILVEWDARYEYRMAPNQSIRRFGKRIETNALGLRSRPFEPRKLDPNELRVLVIGDSVMQGGSHVDQESLATAILERALAERLKRPVLVINASANSWGPANQLAFVDAEGTFDADIAILVLSSHDLVDLPLQMERAREHDGKVMNRPWCAITEVLGMVWARVVPGALPAALDENDGERIAAGRSAVRALLERLRERLPSVVLALHWDRDEQASGTPRPAHAELVAMASELGIEVWNLGPALAAGERSKGEPSMADRIHPSESGQALLGEEFSRRMSEIMRPPHE